MHTLLIHTHTDTYTSTHTHTYIYTSTHTHKHTHTHLLTQARTHTHTDTQNTNSPTNSKYSFDLIESPALGNNYDLSKLLIFITIYTSNLMKINCIDAFDLQTKPILDISAKH